MRALSTGLIGWLLGIGFLAMSVQAQERIPLHVAVQKGLVNVEVTGRGVCSGDAVQVEVRRTPAAGHVIVEVNPGTVIETTVDGVQSMALQKVRYVRVGVGNFQATTEIDLIDDKPRTCVMVGFCRNFRKKTPQAEHRFSVHAPDARDGQLIETAAKYSTTVKVTQAALWIQREGVNEQDLQKRYRLTSAEVQAAKKLVVCVNQPDPSVDVQVDIQAIAQRLKEARAGKITKGDAVVTKQDMTVNVIDRNRLAARRENKDAPQQVRIAAGTTFEVVRNMPLKGLIEVNAPDGNGTLEIPKVKVELLHDSNRRIATVAGTVLEGFDLEND